MKCPRCQAENREGRRFCSKRGSPLALVYTASSFVNARLGDNENPDPRERRLIERTSGNPFFSERAKRMMSKRCWLQRAESALKEER